MTTLEQIFERYSFGGSLLDKISAISEMSEEDIVDKRLWERDVEIINSTIYKWKDDSKKLEKINSGEFLEEIIQLQYLNQQRFLAGVTPHDDLSSKLVPYDELIEETKEKWRYDTRVFLKIFQKILNEDTEEKK